jgi:two-component system, chemotaxis family, protein-glutamate methylesterase/glutaminase
MKTYGVLVVDDSALMRKAITKLLENDPQFTVIGVARNGLDAIEKVHRLRPDLVTLDVEMPEMDGLIALRTIMNEAPLPVVMLSSHTGQGAEATLQALEQGAVDFFLKENLFLTPIDPNRIEDFYCRLRNAVTAKLPPKIHTPELVHKGEPAQYPDVRSKGAIDLLIIGCSTGGPSALQSILPKLPANIGVPVVVVQHMPPGFTKPLADRFDSLCVLQVKEAEQGERLKPGTIYVAPAGFQTQLTQHLDGAVALSVQESSRVETLYKPSIDVTVCSASPIFREGLLTVILTGMGSDGLEGCRTVKAHGGMVITESEQTCVVYGMPRVVVDAGLSDEQLPLPEMGDYICSRL